jgi:hypothetical protein
LLIANLVDPSPEVSSHAELSLTRPWLAETLFTCKKIGKCPKEAEIESNYWLSMSPLPENF